jgi:myo-inositol-1(or 4)-monophosphatase
LDKDYVPIEDLKAFAIDFIEKAGEEALKYYGRGAAQVKFDETLITEVELQLNGLFQKELQARFPEHHCFDGQSPDEAYTHEAKRYVWIFDPLDGMSNFMDGIPVWGMSIALLDNKWPVLGAFYMPATGDLFHALAGQEAFRGTRPIHVSSQTSISDESVLLTFSRFHQHYRSGFPGKQLNLGCTSAHICFVAMGFAEAALIANESYQDLAAVRVIMEAAGGHFMRLNGTKFPIAEYLEGPVSDSHLLALPTALFAQINRCLENAL